MANQQLQVNGTTSPPTQNFGDVAVGEFDEITLTLRNESSPSISMSGNVGSLSAPYSVQSGGGVFVLANHGDTKNVVVRFTPSASGVAADTLSITHDAPVPGSPIQVSLTGVGFYALETIRKTAAGEVKVLIYGPTAFSNCAINSIGLLDHGYDDEDETIFFPANVRLRFTDFSRDLYNRLLLNEDKVEVFLNGSLEYRGYVYTKETRHDRGQGISEIMIADNSQRLKDIKLVDSGNNALNPLGYSADTYVRMGNLITDIWTQVLDASPSVEFNLDWTFRDVSLNTFIWSDLRFNTNQYFFGSVKPFATLRDLLKFLAKAFCCITGSLDSRKFYLLKIYKTSGSTVSLTGKVKKLTQVAALTAKVGVEMFVKYANGAATVHVHTGTVDETPASDHLHPEELIVAEHWFKDDSNPWYFNLVSGSPVACLEAKDTNIDSTYRFIPTMAAVVYYTYRQQNRERYELTLYGVNHSIVNIYTFESKTLRPVKVSRDFENNETKMTVIDVTS